MSQTRQFIDQLASGESSAAKESLENMISTKAFEALDVYKKEMASSIFGGVKEETESLEELSKTTLSSYRDKASAQADKYNDRSDRLETAIDRAKTNPSAKPRSDATIRQKYGTMNKYAAKADKRTAGEYRAFEKSQTKTEQKED